MCQGGCFQNSTIQIPTGATGTQGVQGEYGGYASNWLFNASTASGSSATEIRLNNAAPASVTTIYVNDTNADSVDLSAFLASLNNSGNYGNIRLFKESDSKVYAMYIVTAVVDSGSEYALTVTYVGSNSTFTANDSVVLEFVPKGAAGVASAGTEYQEFDYNSFDQAWTASPAETDILNSTFTAPSDGNYQIMYTSTSFITTPATGANGSSVDLYVNGVSVQSKLITNASGTALTALHQENTFIWRGALTTGQVVKLVGKEGPDDTIVTTSVSYIVNKEI